MEFLNYKAIKTRQNRKGLLYKKPNPRDVSAQYYSLARELDDHKLYSGLCHLAVNTCFSKDYQVEAYLQAARAFSKGSTNVIHIEDHVQSVKRIYKEALLICDSSFMIPIYLELGRFYESHNMHLQAAECYKQSLSMTRCVRNLILSRHYKRALEELRNSPSQLLSRNDKTTMYLLELLLNEDEGESNNLSMINPSNNRQNQSDLDLLPIDDNLFELHGLLDSLLICRKDRIHNPKIEKSLVSKLSAFLDQTQIHLLYLILASSK